MTEPAKPQPRDMMLIPGVLPAGVFPPDEARVFNENRVWSGQWKAKLPGERGTVEIAAQAAMPAIQASFRTAASQARGREVILFAGHGADASISSLNQAAFDLGPEPGLLNVHTNVITDEITRLEEVATRSGNAFTPKTIVLKDGTKQTLSQASIDARVPRFLALEQIGKTLRDAGVAQLRLLTCDVGLEPAFADRVARITGMRLVCYLQLVQTSQVDFTGPPPANKPLFSKVEIFVGPDGSAPPPVRDPSSFTPPETVADFHGQAVFTEIPTQKSISRSPPARPTP
jgi:hypothetical protein